MTTLRNFQDVELEVKRTNLEVERLLTDVRLILDRINHITGISGSFSASPSLATNHGILTGLGDDDHPHYLLASGTRELTGDWDAGPFSITAETLISDVAIGTAPLTVTSTTVVPNLNVDQVDGFHLDQDVTSGASPTFDGVNFTGIDISDATNLAGGSGITLNDDTVDLDINSLAVATIATGDFVPFWDITVTATNKKITFASLEGTIDHGNIAGIGDDDHSQYALLAGRATGQTLIGGTASGENLTLQSTAHATKGSILFGASAYDEVNNRLGVGTTTPGTTLEVTGSSYIQSATSHYITFLGSSSSASGSSILLRDEGEAAGLKNWYIRSVNSDFQIGTATDGFAYNVAKLHIEADGNIGIGTIGPSQLVHAKKDQNAATSLRVENLTDGTASLAGVRLATAGGQETLFSQTPNAFTTISGWNDAFYIDVNAATPGGMILSSAHASGSINFYVAGRTSSELRMKINSSGDVGIGTLVPQRLLQVGAGVDAPFQGYEGIYTAINGIAQITCRNNTDNVEVGMFAYQAGGSLGAYIGTWTNHKLFIRTNNINAITIETSGDIGVGIATPDGAFHIHTATAGAVTASTGADELVLENSTSGGMSILVPDASTSQIYFGSPSDNVGAKVSWNYNSKLLTLGTQTASGEINMLVGSGTEVFRIDISENFGFRTTSEFGSGFGVLGIRNAGTNPSTNPTNGGILYSDAGTGKWRSSSGTTTTFGPAEPYCKVCGRDFVLEWENKKTGHLIVCMWCLTKKLGEEKWITRVN